MKKVLQITLAGVLLGFTISAHAVLIDRGSGMIYDTDQGITWLQNANAPELTSPSMNWNDAMAWAAALEFGGYADWRLPTSPATAQGNINEGEMGYLYYTILGNPAGGPRINSGPFINIAPPGTAIYWLDAEPLSQGSAWSFWMDLGFQNAESVGNVHYAWAVRDGDYGPSVSTSTAYELDNFTLGEELSFEFWWEMGMEPPPYAGQSFDVLALQGGDSWQYIGQTAAYGSSTDWQLMSLLVPEELQGMETRIRFILSDYGPETDPTVYLRNINSAPVPEPSTILLLGAGLIGLAGLARKKLSV